MNDIKSTVPFPPYPYFGGKRRIASLVWERLGDPSVYFEPFFGSGAVLLARPTTPKREIINDIDGYVCNFWRAVKADPEKVAEYADQPSHENQLHAVHSWLVGKKESLRPQLEGDPEWHDAKIAGYWVYGMAFWLGDEFCSGKGPWHVTEAGTLEKTESKGGGIHRQIPQIGCNCGVKRRIPVTSCNRGVKRKMPLITGDRGVQRQLITANTGLLDYITSLHERMKHVIVCCGDWSRVLTKSIAEKKGAAIFLDPPYDGHETVYNNQTPVAKQVEAWVKARPNIKIALCGYEKQYDLPDWECVAWRASGGFGNANSNNSNRHKERVWFSPAT